MESQDADDEKSPRHLASKLQLEVAASLKNNGANTRAPCPMADLIFEMLFGRLWMQSTIVRSNKHAEEMFELIKLDHDATLDFYRYIIIFVYTPKIMKIFHNLGTGENRL